MKPNGLNSNEQIIYRLLTLKEQIYELCNIDDIDDELAEIISKLANELNVNI